MKKIYGLENLEKFVVPTAVTIGVFDAVHLGHRKIIETCVAGAAEIEGEAVVVTFEPMPLEVIAPRRAPKRLTTLEQKADLIEEMGADALVVVEFTEEFADLQPEAFADRVISDRLNAKRVVVGCNFHFGADRKGDVRLLEERLSGGDVAVEAVDLLEIDGEIVSSTRIRNLLARGAIEEAAGLLGRYPSVDGIVVYGLGRGVGIGFATANVEALNPGAVPMNGVYAALTDLDGEVYASVVDVGVSPTFGDIEAIEVHVHIIGYEGSIYDKRLKIEIRKRLRDEVAFENVWELTVQIGRDVAETLALLSG